MEVTCAEAPGQDALFRMEIPEEGGGEEGEIGRRSDVRGYIAGGDLVPRPCLPRGKRGGTTSSRSNGVVGDTDRNMLTNVVAPPPPPVVDRLDSNKRRKGEGGRAGDDCNVLRCCANCSSSFSQQLQKLIDSTTTSTTGGAKDGKGVVRDDDESRDLLESISKIQKYINK